MKKIILLFCIAVCLTLPVFAQEKTENQYTNVPTVNYCELRKNPELYNGKMIRVRGIYEYGFEQSAFYDKACFEDSSFSRFETWLWFFSLKNTCSDNKTAEILKTFHSGRADSKLEVTLVGMFNGSKDSGGYGHLNGYKFQIKVSCFEQAKLLPIEKYGCKRIDDTKPFHYLSYVRTEVGETPNYENSSKKQKKEKLIWLQLNNNSTCAITVPTTSNEPENRELKNQSEIPVIYQLSSRCVTRKSKLISEQKQTFSVLSAGNSIYFAVPLRYLTEEPFDIRIAFGFFTEKADSFYQPFYFSQYDLPENLRKDIDCRKF